MPSSLRPSIGIYFSHYECFGHVSRVMAVAEVIKKRFPKGNLFFIQAGVAQPKARLDQWGKVYQLPNPYVSRRNFVKPSHLTANNLAQRIQSCLNILAEEKPNLIITELFPLGREESRHELIPVLVQASRQGAALWSVAGYPLLTDLDAPWRDKIMNLYQKILILSPRIEQDFLSRSFSGDKEKAKYLGFYQKHHKKIHFCGYLLPSMKIVDDDQDKELIIKSASQRVCRVAVVRGGGVCYPKLIAQAIRASDALGKGYFFTIVAGPSATDKEWSLFRTLIKRKRMKNVALFRSLQDYEGLIKKSDVCVSIASYHSATMILKHRKSAVIVPFLGYSKEMCFHEQPARARLLQDVMGAQVISIHQLTANRLKTAIQKARAHRVEARISENWFSGKKNLDREFADFWGKSLEALSNIQLLGAVDKAL